ncbi:M60 family peptidase N-terminal accessory domain-containing protein [Brasilonema sp. UFV-L1]|uniref:M60 family peptidase N-terminal accessory domain-containing protein n=1 Tax=Brasilonema sp. UFV-L1 TaxID=2234130 RepID=UPI00145FB338|nr:M60 family peptidase N-terminal accessory domain-containing protein [Brasilonema sp. UFV-L1]NMG07123.1 hypothetical protein [Brasilonema sp. UFV-L1]
MFTNKPFISLIKMISVIAIIFINLSASALSLNLDSEISSDPISLQANQTLLAQQALTQDEKQVSVNSLLNDLTTLDAYKNGSSDNYKTRVLYPFGSEAFGVLADSGGKIVAAGAKYGKGRIVVYARKSYKSSDSDFALPKSDDGNQLQFLSNSLNWLSKDVYAGATSTNKMNLLTNHEKQASDAHSSWNLSIIKTTDFTTLSKELANPVTYPVTYVVENWSSVNPTPTLKDTEVKALLEYVNGGGSLLIKEPYTRAESTWNSDIPKGINKILTTAGIAMTTEFVEPNNNTFPVNSPVAGNYTLPQVTPLANHIQILQDREYKQAGTDAAVEEAMIKVRILLDTDNAEVLNMLDQWRGNSPKYPNVLTLEQKSFQKLASPISYLAVLRDSLVKDMKLNYWMLPTITGQTPVTANVTFNIQDEPNYLRDYGQPEHVTSARLYANPNSTLTVTVPDIPSARDGKLGLRINNHSDVKEKEKNATVVRPFQLRENYPLNVGVNRINLHLGGLVYLTSTSLDDENITVSIEGAYNSPYFKLSETTPTGWDTVQSKYGGGFLEIESKYMIFTMDTGEKDIVTGKEVEAYAKAADRSFKAHLNYRGLDDSIPAHKPPNLKYRVTLEYDTICSGSDGYACSGTSSGPTQVTKLPFYYSSLKENTAAQLRSGNYFVWHELGHVFGSSELARAEGNDGMALSEPLADYNRVAVTILSGNITKYLGGREYTDITNGTVTKLDQYVGELLEQLFSYYNQESQGGIDQLAVLRNIHRQWREFPKTGGGACDPKQFGGGLDNADFFVYAVSKGMGVDLRPWFKEYGHTASAEANTCIGQLNLTKVVNPADVKKYIPPQYKISTDEPSNRTANSVELNYTSEIGGTLYWSVDEVVDEKEETVSDIVNGNNFYFDPVLHGNMPVVAKTPTGPIKVPGLKPNTKYLVQATVYQSGIPKLYPSYTKIVKKEFTTLPDSNTGLSTAR